MGFASYVLHHVARVRMALVLCAMLIPQVASAQSLGDQVIVPGERVGSIRLGMTWDDVISLLGQPTSSFTNMGDPAKVDTYLQYDSLNLHIIFSNTAAPVVTYIQVQAWTQESFTFGTVVWSNFDPVSSNFHTADGIVLGSSSFDVLKKLGSGFTSNGGPVFMQYPGLGVFFNVTVDHRVWKIQVQDRQ